MRRANDRKNKRRKKALEITEQREARLTKNHEQKRLQVKEDDTF